MRAWLAPLLTFLAGLRYRTLFLIASVLFFGNLFVPDAIPFVDEILLGIATIVLGRLRRDPAPPKVREERETSIR